MTALTEKGCVAIGVCAKYAFRSSAYISRERLQNICTKGLCVNVLIWSGTYLRILAHT